LERFVEYFDKALPADQQKFDATIKDFLTIARNICAKRERAQAVAPKVQAMSEAQRLSDLKQQMKEMFDLADTNNDGCLSREELDDFISKNAAFRRMLVQYDVKYRRSGVRRTKVKETDFEGSTQVRVIKEYIPDYDGNEEDVSIVLDYFRAMDLNHDDKIDILEFLEAMDFKLAMCEMFDSIDADGNRGIDKQELDTALYSGDSRLLKVLLSAGVDIFEVFSTFDANHDGIISLDEFLAVVLKAKGATSQTMPPTNRPVSQLEHTTPSEELAPSPDVAFQTTVKKHSTKAQVKAEVKALFKAADINGDGVLSREELLAFVSANSELQQLLERSGLRCQEYVEGSRNEAEAALRKLDGAKVMQDYFDAMDEDANDEVDLFEFLRAIDFSLELCEIFDQMDTDVSGDVDRAELRAFMDLHHNLHFTQRLIDANINPVRVFDELDTDHNDRISLSEFMEIAARTAKVI